MLSICALEGLGRPDHRFQPLMSRPEIPAPEKLAHRRGITVIPHPPQVLLDRPGPAHLEIQRPQRGTLLLPQLGQMLLTPQPQILGAFQRRLASLREIAVLAFAHLVHRFQEVAHHVNAVKHDLRLGLRTCFLVAAT